MELVELKALQGVVEELLKMTVQYNCHCDWNLRKIQGRMIQFEKNRRNGLSAKCIRLSFRNRAQDGQQFDSECPSAAGNTRKTKSS